MKDIEDNSIQLILTDPPYQSTECKWDKLPDISELFSEWKRILTVNGSIVMTMAFPAAIDFINADRDIFKYDAIWIKNRKTNFVNAKNKFLRQHENILIFSKGTTANGSNNKMIYNPQGLVKIDKKCKSGKNKGKIGIRSNYENNIYIREYTNYPSTLIDINGKRYTKHHTEKPIELFEYLVKRFSNDRDTILDPFAGSGTTGIAALKSNRKVILIEKDKHWYDVIEDRIKNEIENKNGLGK